MTRNGKIARLPRKVREELNRRLDDGEPAVELVEWLNGLQEAQKVLQAHFGGRPISKQNVSEWKSGGHQEWLARQEVLEQARELAAEAGEVTEATGGRLTDHLATVLASRYAAALAGWDGEVTEAFERKLQALRAMCQDIVSLRRGDHSSARLEMERERVERERKKTPEELVEDCKDLMSNLGTRRTVCKEICRFWLTPEERERRIRAIFSLDPIGPENAADSEPDFGPVEPNQSESKPVKPDQTSSCAAENLGCRVPPHPGPLPVGEGESSSDCGRIEERGGGAETSPIEPNQSESNPVKADQTSSCAPGGEPEAAG